MPPGFPTSAMLRSFQGVLGATDPRNILSEGMKGRFVLKTGVCFCVKILLLCDVSCWLCVLFCWLGFSCDFLRFIDFQLNRAKNVSMLSNGASSSTTSWDLRSNMEL